jgi:predicted alpha/beta superfamily hydrolase
MDWMVHTFKKQIDRRYRTLGDREHTFIAGSSMGGLMSLYAVLEYNHYFSRAAALSPSIWVAPEKLEKLARSTSPQNTVVYMDYGEIEMGKRSSMRRHFAKLTAAMMENGILLESRIVPGGTHSEASWERQIPFFMGTLFS